MPCVDSGLTLRHVSKPACSSFSSASQTRAQLFRVLWPARHAEREGVLTCWVMHTNPTYPALRLAVPCTELGTV